MRQTLDTLSKGSWIINSGKHLLGVRQNTPELAFFEATEFSSKSATLLARLVADEQETILASKVHAFARESGISRGEMISALKDLQDLGRLSLNTDRNNQLVSVEVYTFSLADAVRAASQLYDKLGPSEYEEAALITLQSTFQLPRRKEELVESIAASGLSESVAAQSLDLQETLDLLRVSRERSGSIYYNEYAFSEGATKIMKALDGLEADERQAVIDIQDLVQNYPGYSLERLKGRFPSKIVNMMEGVGLIDVVTVESDAGEGNFVTAPQMKGISIQSPVISLDVFHKAKLLLSSLRFGEFNSSANRGRIDTSEKMLNIVKKMNRGEWVGPCRAIGQDYQLLERDGVIETLPYRNGMYHMKLRQLEVGKLVRQLLEHNRVVPEIDVELQGFFDQQPTSYTIPEQRRSQIIARSVKPVREIRERLLESLRTGMR